MRGFVCEDKTGRLRDVSRSIPGNSPVD